MDSGSSATLGLFGLWMFVQLALALVLLVGGIYVLYCLSRAASGLDRLANTAENWLKFQMYLEEQKQREVKAQAETAAAVPVPEAPASAVAWNQEPANPTS